MACPRPSPVTCGGIRFQAAQRERAAIKPPASPLSRLAHSVRSRSGETSFRGSSTASTAFCSVKPCGRGSARVRQGLRAGSGGDRVEARRQPILERKQQAVAEVEEPCVCAGVRIAAEAPDASADGRHRVTVYRIAELKFTGTMRLGSCH